MARYRVGDTYLSEDEYRGYRQARFTFRLLVVAAALGGFAGYRLGVDHALPHAARFALTCGGAAFAAAVAFAAREILYVGVRALLAAGLVAAGLYAVWELVGRG